MKVWAIRLQGNIKSQTRKIARSTAVREGISKLALFGLTMRTVVGLVVSLINKRQDGDVEASDILKDAGDTPNLITFKNVSLHKLFADNASAPRGMSSIGAPSLAYRGWAQTAFRLRVRTVEVQLPTPREALRTDPFPQPAIEWKESLMCELMKAR
ncbi:hypothetical protein K488DRAFT_74800 [Vararia minispora EC-137]|uniref:Uncharacterized protein n=1 Tax=Vararia minispora EC-137 TaxID=1314806 RepID=A0ACB8Q5U4_9AGAM|nr:hypothetical protein K488DRAFT_74800 [Vararia minispora EC-137]